jgi:hypothetical protein
MYELLLPRAAGSTLGGRLFSGFGRGISGLAGEQGVNGSAYGMQQRDVAFLNVRRNSGRHHEADFRLAGQVSALSTGECNGGEAQVARDFDSLDDVRRAPAGADPDGDISGTPERANLARENLLEAIVIPDGGQGGAVRSESDRRQSFAVARETADEFGGHVLRIRRAAPVSEEQELVSACEGGANFLYGLDESIEARVRKFLACLGAFAQPTMKIFPQGFRWHGAPYPIPFL